MSRRRALAVAILLPAAGATASCHRHYATMATAMADLPGITDRRAGPKGSGRA